MRLIDADELLKAVDKEREYLLARGQTGAEHILVHNFRDLIDNAPTIASDEAIKNFTLYNYPLKPGCNVKKTDDEKEISGLLSED